MGCQRDSLNRGPRDRDPRRPREPRHHHRRRESRSPRAQVMNSLRPSNNDDLNGQDGTTDRRDSAPDRAGRRSSINYESLNRGTGRPRRNRPEADNTDDDVLGNTVLQRFRRAREGRQTFKPMRIFSKQCSPTTNARSHRPQLSSRNLNTRSSTDDLITYDDFLDDVVQRLGILVPDRLRRDSAPSPDILPSTETTHPPMEEREQVSDVDMDIEPGTAIALGYDGARDTPMDFHLEDSKDNHSEDDGNGGLVVTEIDAAEAYLSLSMASQLRTVLNDAYKEDRSDFEAVSPPGSPQHDSMSIGDYSDEEIQLILSRRIIPSSDPSGRAIATEAGHHHFLQSPPSPPGSEGSKKRGCGKGNYSVQDTDTPPLSPLLASTLERLSIDDGGYRLTPNSSPVSSAYSPYSPSKRARGAGPDGDD